MHIRCPHCQNPLELVAESSLKDVVCPTCGSSFNLVANTSTATHQSRPRMLGHFELLEQVGSGAFGSVWKARDTELDRTVAVKIPRSAQLSDAEAESFLREARAAAQLRHERIVSVHEVGKQDGTLYIASDYIEGATLAQWLTAHRPSAREAAGLCVAIAEALGHAHERGVVHRDLKPSNIMMDLNGQPHLTDFGLAKRDSGEITMTVDGRVLGTPAYMSPEQARGEAHRADARSDLYSLGVILFELLTGELPFRGAQRMLIVQILQDEPPSPRRLNAAIPRDLETITLKCLEKDPPRRYRAAAEVAAELRRYLAGKPIHARPVGRAERLWRWYRREPLIAALCAAVFVALTAGIAVSTYFAVEATTNAGKALASAAHETSLRERTQFQAARVKFEQGMQRFEQDNPSEGIALLTAALVDIEGRSGSDYSPLAIPEAQTFAHSLRNHLLYMAVAPNCPRACLTYNQTVRSIAFSPDGARVATAHADGEARLWDAATGRPTGVTFKHGNWVRSVAFSPDGTKLATAAADGTAQLWDLATGKPLGELMKHQRWVMSVAFSPDGTKLVTASDDRTARIWDAATGKALGEPLHHRGVVWSAEFSPDGAKVATASEDRYVRLWDVATGAAVGEPLPHKQTVWRVAFCPKGKLLAAAITEGAVVLWNLDTNQPVGESLQHQQSVWSLAFSPDGSLLATASQDGTARLWNVATGKQAAPTLQHRATVWSVAFSPDGNSLATACDDGIARIWEVAGGTASLGILRHQRAVESLAFNPDGARLVTAAFGGTAQQWAVESGDAVGPPFSFPSDAKSTAFSNDAARFAAGYQDGAIRIWEVATGEPLASPMPLDRQVRKVVFGPDGTTLAAVSDDGALHLWDVATAQPLDVRLVHPSPFVCLAFSPDGSKLATASYDRTSQVWDAGSGKRLASGFPHQEEIVHVAVSPGGTKLATSGASGTAKLWDIATGKPLGEPLRHRELVYRVIFSPDGTKLATASSDATARLWEVATGKPLSEPLKHDSAVPFVAFSPDGTKLATACYDQTARLWPVLHEPDEPVDQLLLWAATLTGIEYDENAVIRVLMPAELDERRERLDRAGGPPKAYLEALARRRPPQRTSSAGKN